MKRVNAIINHRKFQANLEKNQKAEETREFCKHNLQHFLDVARVAYIISLERSLAIDKEVIYAAALLHDIGRWKQYEDGTDHGIAGAELAKDILMECNFNIEETDSILQAIRKHRSNKDLVSGLDQVLYDGDKLSRPCIGCCKIKDCNRFKEEEEANLYY